MRELNISFIPPSKCLREFIDCYWIWESDENSLTELPRILPSTNIEVVFYYQSPFICTDHNNNSSKLPLAHIVGVQKTYMDLCATGQIGLIAIRFLPGTFHQFCKEQIGEFTDHICNISEVWGQLGDELQYKIHEASTTQHRIDIIEHYLLLLLKSYYKNTTHQAIQSYAINQLMQSNSKKTIPHICNEVGISQRQLQRIFNDLVGVSPKYFQKISMFENTSRTICLLKEHEYLTIILENGYYDQAHFINIFKQLSGTNPLSLLSKNFMSYFYNTVITPSPNM
ncbi:hypothetical protein BFG57_16140 [Bacillus solimangrovi]|uniref:HTH araC/xylS-type domain-containing protein n=2 Tax=Bacillus solimangrovi TaxID=1305675 RepID=A0A1E5LE65_9BACI|nr:hypothetical protein BFG57_16140 [Bacillus solimangrovi]